MVQKLPRRTGVGLYGQRIETNRTMEKPMGLITEVTESMGNSRDSRPTIAASKRALNGAILAAEISEKL